MLLIIANENLFYHMSRVVRKLVLVVPEHVRYKPGCTTTEGWLRLEISDLRSRGNEISTWWKQMH